MAKGMWGIGLAWAVLAVLSGTVLHWIGMFFMPALANRHDREHLGSRSYVNHERATGVSSVLSMRSRGEEATPALLLR